MAEEGKVVRGATGDDAHPHGQRSCGSAFVQKLDEDSKRGCSLMGAEEGLPLHRPRWRYPRTRGRRGFGAFSTLVGAPEDKALEVDTVDQRHTIILSCRAHAAVQGNDTSVTTFFRQWRGYRPREDPVTVMKVAACAPVKEETCGAWLLGAKVVKDEYSRGAAALDNLFAGSGSVRRGLTFQMWSNCG